MTSPKGVCVKRIYLLRSPHHVKQAACKIVVLHDPMANAGCNSSPHTPLQHGLVPQDPQNWIGPGAHAAATLPAYNASPLMSLILVPPPSGRLCLCVFLHLPPWSRAVILPIRHRPWRVSLVKSAICPGGKWFQLTNSTAYVPRSSFTLKALTPFLQTMSDSASVSTLVDDDVRYKPHSIPSNK